jgi:hypothetical protein
MDLNDNSENAEYEIKIFQIDKSFYEFKKHNLQNNEQIINYIINEHRIKVKDVENYNKKIVPILIEDVDYFTYVYNEEEKDAFWKKFIPESLSNNLVFKVQQLSFAMFASIEDNIYAIVGGGGSRVIIRFQNHRFGLDFFEYITDLNEDVISIETRGISGKLTKRKDIFKDGLKLVDILNFTNIPSKINIILKQEIKDSVFDFIEFDNRITTIEIGSYFNIKYRIPFKSLHLLFKKINEVSKSETKKSLTSFVEVKDKGVISGIYREELLLKLFENMMDLFSPARSVTPKKFDIEFVHPSKIQEFYEAEFYVFKFKGERKGHNFQNRKNLYYDGLKLVYESIENLNLIEFKKAISGLHLYGMRKKEDITHAMFLDHIVCEINVENRPIFQIDAKWFKVENNFTNTINEICSRMIDNNYLNSGIVNEKWNNTEDEDTYNRKYHLQNNYWVLDKAIGQNIELCDIMYEDDNSIYFIHVKNGFDAKIRDLSNQIQISASRFMNERNSGSEDFILSIIDAYNNKAINSDKLIDKDSFKAKFKTGGKNIQFVMAFKSEIKKIPQIKNNVEKVQSNIAKYSLIQCVREMNMLTFPIKIVEIER